MDQAALPTTNAIIYPAPVGEAASDDYLVTIDGRPVFVHRARVSAVPFNQVWPGYQRPLEQTELAAFASWDMSGPVEVTVTAKRPFTDVKVRPLASGIVPRISGRSLTMTVTRPGQFMVELDGMHHTLHCFANPPAVEPPASQPDVLRFGPGVHEAGIITAHSGQTIQIDGGAVVYGAIQADGVHGLRITGRGVLDGSRFTREAFNAEQGPFGAICLANSTACVVEGITLRDPHVWTVIAVNCTDTELRNIKLIGLWRYNADGIDLLNSSRMTVRDCFVRAYDDCVVLKGVTRWGPHPAGVLPVEDILVERCVLWNDWGRCLEVGAETCAPAIRRVLFRDCDLIHTTHVAMDIQHGDRAEIEDISYDGIRVEFDSAPGAPQFQSAPDAVYGGAGDHSYLPQLMVVGICANYYSQDKTRGTVQRVRFNDIRVTSPAGMPPSLFFGSDAEHRVRDIRIQGLVVNGRAVDSLAEGRFDVHPFVDGVVIGGGPR